MVDALLIEEVAVKDADAVGINLTLGMGWDMVLARIWVCMSVSLRISLGSPGCRD